MPPPPGEVATQVTVSHSEVDKMGVARQERYFRWFSAGLEAFLKARGWSREMEHELGVDLPIVESYLRLQEAASCDDILDVYAWPKVVDSRRFTMAYRVVRPADGVEVAEGYTVQACLAATGRPRRLPAPLLAAVG